VRNPVMEFEEQYRAAEDPWNLASSPYEQAKYDRTIEALGDRTYPFALELGASIGVLSERLARRCGRLVTLEPAPTAVERARRRLAGLPNVDVRLGSAPEDLPEFRFAFDLIVCSEVLYYFSRDELAVVLDVLESRLPRAGTLLAVSWRGRGTHQLTGDEVHAVLRERPGLVRVHGEVHERYLLDRFERR
jgi:cyclopropane fatty-acyl-phospholipid synthase-like methyltransferase